MCEANLAGSFEKASRLLDSLGGLRVSAKQAQLVTERVGAVLAAEREAETGAFLDLTAPDPCVAPSVLVVSADGGRVQTRQDDPSQKWKEDKIGVVWETTPSPEKAGHDYEGPRPRIRSVTATMSDWNALGDHLSALAHRRGYSCASVKLFISDGAFSLRSLRERCLPDAIFILDWAHAVEHVHACSRAGFGDTAQADRWHQRQAARLWEGRVDLVVKNLRSLARRLGPPPDRAGATDPRRILANNVQYFRDNAAGMDYATFRRKGWPIGSGVMESVVKQLGMRVKGSEKHWGLQGVEATLQVVAALHSEDGAWDRFWQHAPLAA